jgi:hypothetical protein
MESMKTQLIVWMSGFVAGLVVLESLRRLGDRSNPTAEGVADVLDAGATRPASADKPKGLKSIVAGATAQAERARQIVGQTMPWVKDSRASPTDTTPTSRIRSTNSSEGNEGCQ